MDLVRDLARVGRHDLALVGGKAANLGELVRAQLPVPPGFVVTTHAYRAFVEANAAVGRAQRDGEAAAVRAAFEAGEVPGPVRAEITTAYAALGSAAVAVRSSATAEDLAEASFAGQQDTFLNVRGADAVLAAVRSCWASLWSDRAIAYRARHPGVGGDLALAVVVQELVDVEASGVMFTANPSTGRRDQTVISAAWGLGESVVGGTVTTDDLMIDRASATVSVRSVSDKAVRTVARGSGTVEEPVPDDLRLTGVLTDAEAVQLARLGDRAAAHLGAPQDLEWARADGRPWLVQSRPITALPPPEAPPPTTWAVPRPRDLYVRASIVEQLPDPLTPLFAELVDRSVTRSLQRVFAELLGSAHVVRDDDVELTTVNGYAYYRYSLRGGLRLLLRFPRALPVLRADGPRSAITRWRVREQPAYAAVVARWRDVDPASLGPGALLDGVVELLDAGTVYYTAVQTVIPIAASSETAFAAFDERLVRRRGDPPAATYLLGFDSAPIRADQALFDLATWSRGRTDLAAWLVGHPTPEVVAAYERGPVAPPDGVAPDAWSAWVERFRAHLDRFGHAVYNLDFANAVAADEPGPLVETLRYYLQGRGVDPYARQRAAAARRDGLETATLARLDPLRRTVFRRLLRRAQRTAPVREDALADMGLAWPTLRRLLRELGRRLAEAGAVVGPDDVFWLRRAEIEAALGASQRSYAEVVEQRRELWRGQRRVTPPQLLPAGGWVELFRRWLPAASEAQDGDVITGLAGSPGTVTARARVLGGPADFGRLQPGEVLVATITTPAWTPLFALAAGVVTDIGGPLSHSSIVAREYGIPAVLGTGAATRRIADGQEVTVDGGAGVVRLIP